MSADTTVLFVCLHGSAKSLVAARHCERLAVARGFPVQCRSAGLEPDSSVPPNVVAGLREDGIDVSATLPARATAELVDRAEHVVAFGCDLSTIGIHRDVIRWDDVPAVSDGYGAARDVIVARVQALLAALAVAPDPPAPS